ncbi:MAG: PRC-barrel domain-containing protein [Clostridium sp.]
MLRSKDFYLKAVFNEKGKRLGVVEDLYIDFHNGKVLGFEVSSYSFFSKRNYIDIKDVIVFDDEIITKDIKVNGGLRLNEIKGMDIIDRRSNMKGVVEDIVIDKNSYDIKGLIMSAGIIERILRGKDILLLNECVLCENYILYYGNDGITFKTIPHSVGNNGMVKEI